MAGAYKTTSPLLCLPSAANGVTVTPPGIADGWSTWVEISASAPTDMRVATLVAFPPRVGFVLTRGWYEVELGVGASAGAATAIAAARGFMGNNNGGDSDASDLLHLAVAADVVTAGDHLWVRLRQSSTDTSVWRIAMQYWALPMNGNVPGATVGPVNVPSGSRLTVTSGAANVYGAWVQVDAATAVEWALGNVVCIGPREVLWQLEFGIGAAASEVPIGSVRSYATWFAFSDAFQGGPWNILLRPTLAVPAGSRLAVRIRSSGGVAAFGLGLTVIKESLPGVSSSLLMAWTDWVAIPSVAGGYGNFTAWTTMIDPTATDIALSGISKTFAQGGLTGHVLAQIGIGAIGDETLIAEFYFNTAVWSGGRFNVPLNIARIIPAGSRVALRYYQEAVGSGVGNSFTLSYQEIITAPDFDNYDSGLIQQAYVTSVPPIGFPLSCTTGGSAWANGAWVEIDASVPVNRVITAYEFRGPEHEVELDLGTGAAGSEVVVTTVRWAGSLSEGACIFNDVMSAPTVIVESSRLAMRARCSNTGATLVQFTPHYTAEPVDPPTPPSPVLPGTTTFQIRRLRRTPTIFADGNRIFHQRLQIECQPGIGNEASPTPTMLIRFSDDGGLTWSNTREATPGEVGDYLHMVRLYGMGSAYNRAYEVVVSDPAQWALIQAWTDLEAGSH